MPRRPPQSPDQGRWVTSYQKEFTWKVREPSPVSISTPPQPIPTTLATPTLPANTVIPLPPTVPPAPKATCSPLLVTKGSPESPRHVHYRVCAQAMPPNAPCSFDTPTQHPPTDNKRPSIDTEHCPPAVHALHASPQPQAAPTSLNQPTQPPPASAPHTNGALHNPHYQTPTPLVPLPAIHTSPSTPAQATPNGHVTALPDSATDPLANAMRASLTALDRNVQALERVAQRLAQKVDRMNLARACEPQQLPKSQCIKASVANHSHSLSFETNPAVAIGNTVQRLKAILEAP
ncbi:hypothetical protein H4R35_006648 [Dimargaris xerosporica]|nr:hypothetical protein H4R35_006648 [Dimargaris xerosporica]